MSSVLDLITTTSVRAPVMTIYGKAGSGKTTLANSFPDVIFLLTEDPGMKVKCLGGIFDSYGKLFNVLDALSKEEVLPFKTLVLDSVSGLDALVTKYILDKEEKEKNKRPTGLSGASGGYGKGFEQSELIHMSFRAMMGTFNKRGISIVFLAHLDQTKYKSPDNEDYDVFNVRMSSDKARRVYTDNVDAVLFSKLKSFVETLDSGRNVVRSTESRVLLTGLDDVAVTKNRFDMPKEIIFNKENGFDAIAKYIPFYTGEDK